MYDERFLGMPIVRKRNREKVAVKFLNMAGYEVYCPFLSTKRGVAPLFPGYLFCWVPPERGWWRARWSIAVRNIVGTHGEPSHVPIKSSRSCASVRFEA